MSGTIEGGAPTETGSSSTTRQPAHAASGPSRVDSKASTSTSTKPPIRAEDQCTLPWTLPSIHELLKRREYVYTTDEQTKAWSDAAEAVKVYSDDMIRRWNGEIDTYLVYAGLFSAILTAFNVQSYILLQPSSPDPAVIALQQILAQLSGFSSDLPPINPAPPAFRPTNTPPPPVPRAAVWINALWFSSLILSLSSASVGITVKQWTNEYNSGISSGTSRKTAQLRQYRLNSLIEWRVRHIVMAIPVLLQLSLALFLAGLLILLWTLDYTVAAVASVMVGLLMSFVLATIILPLVKPACCYISPQTLALYVVYVRVVHALKHLRYHSCRLLLKPVESAYRESAGMAQRLIRRAGHALWMCRGENPGSGNFQTWRGREQSAVFDRSRLLDADLVVMAYETTMDPEMLSLAGICLSSAEPASVIECFERLHDADKRHFGGQFPVFAHVALATTCEAANNLWINTVLCLLSIAPQSRSERWMPLVERLNGYLSFGVTFSRPGRDTRHVEWGLTAFSSIASDVGARFCKALVGTAFTGISEMLRWTALNEAPVDKTAIEYAAAAADWSLHLMPDTGAGWEEICDRALYTRILLQCATITSTATSGAPGCGPNTLLSRAEHALHHLTVSLRGVDANDIGRNHLFTHSYRLGSLAHFLVRNHASLGALVSPDLISALEHGVTLFERVARDLGIVGRPSQVDFEAVKADIKLLRASISSPLGVELV